MPAQWKGCLLLLAPPRGPWGQLHQPFQNLLSKLARVCSGCVRGSHSLPHGYEGSSKAPGELCSPWQPPPNAFRGAAAGCLPPAVPQVHTKRKMIPESKDSLPKQSRAKENHEGEPGGRRRWRYRKKWPLWLLRENANCFNHKPNQVWQILIGAFLWTFTFNLGFPIAKLVQSTHSGRAYTYQSIWLTCIEYLLCAWHHYVRFECSGEKSSLPP